MKKNAIRIAVILDGGLVSDVVTDRPGIEAVVLDLDTEGADDDEIVSLKFGDIQLEGIPCEPALSRKPKFVESLINTHKEK